MHYAGRELADKCHEAFVVGLCPTLCIRERAKKRAVFSRDKELERQQVRGSMAGRYAPAKSAGTH
jgi:hypothetical protein